MDKLVDLLDGLDIHLSERMPEHIKKCLLEFGKKHGPFFARLNNWHGYLVLNKSDDRVIIFKINPTGVPSLVEYEDGDRVKVKKGVFRRATFKFPKKVIPLGEEFIEASRSILDLMVVTDEIVGLRLVEDMNGGISFVFSLKDEVDFMEVPLKLYKVEEENDVPGSSHGPTEGPPTYEERRPLGVKVGILDLGEDVVLFSNMKTLFLSRDEAVFITDWSGKK